MNEQAVFTFFDTLFGEIREFHVHMHGNSRPSAAGKHISHALQYAWELPRFEADEFAAAFIRANKERQGQVRICKEWESHISLSWRYMITKIDGKIYVTVKVPNSEVSSRQGYHRVWQGTLVEMINKFNWGGIENDE